MSTKAKLLAALSAILLAAFTLTSVINYDIARRAVRKELLNSSLPLTGKNIYSEIHAAMMRPILVSSSMASDTFLKGWIESGETDIPGIRRYLTEIKKRYGFLTTFFVSATTDHYYFPGGLLKKISPREPRDIWYYAFVQSRESYDLNVDNSMQDGDTLSIFINYRIEDDKGKLLGVVGVGVDMSHAVHLLKKAQKEYSRSVYLVDQDGLVQVHPDRKRIKKEYITEEPGIRTVAKGILQPRDEAVSYQYDKDGHHFLLSTRYIPEFEWYLIVEQDEGTALTSARDNLIRTLSVGVGASLLIIFLCAVTINHYQTQLESMAKTDPLTGAGNRRALEEWFKLAANRAQRYNSPFSIIIMDLDNFKEVNDRDGHLAGDEVLKSVARCIDKGIRPSDFLARWGGDEFIILMDGTADDAVYMAGRLCRAMQEDDRISLSCGVTQYDKDDSLNSMTQRADQGMYQAKAQGGDGIITS